MDTETLSRIQFAATIAFHYFYPPISIGLGLMGFETIRYYLIINTIKDLYCTVLRKIATTCAYAVTNCHGICAPHFRLKSYQNQLAPSILNLLIQP